MRRVTTVDDTGQLTPLDVVCQMAEGLHLPFTIEGNELSIVIATVWGNRELVFDWMEDVEVLHLRCAFELVVPRRRSDEVTNLANLINSTLWVGHLDVWRTDHLVLYRYALPLMGAPLAVSQCHKMYTHAIEVCDRYFPSFQLVCWGGKSPQEAVEIAEFDTKGEA